MMLYDLQSFFKIGDLNATFKKILKTRANTESKGSDFKFYVYYRVSPEEEPQLVYEDKAKAVYHMVLKSLNYFEENFNENIYTLIGDEEEWKDFLYEYVLNEENRQKYPWSQYWDNGIDVLPTDIVIDLNTVFDEIVDLLFDEGEDFFITFNMDSDSDSSDDSDDDSDSDFSSDESEFESDFSTDSENGD